jgi:hypothetical protein
LTHGHELTEWIRLYPREGFAILQDTDAALFRRPVHFQIQPYTG